MRFLSHQPQGPRKPRPWLLPLVLGTVVVALLIAAVVALLVLRSGRPRRPSARLAPQPPAAWLSGVERGAAPSPLAR